MLYIDKTHTECYVLHDTSETSFWLMRLLLVVGCWLLAIGGWPVLASDCWLLTAGRWLLAAAYCLRACGCRLLFAGCSFLLACWWLVDTDYGLLLLHVVLVCWLRAGRCWLLAADNWLATAICWLLPEHWRLPKYHAAASLMRAYWRLLVVTVGNCLRAAWCCWLWLLSAGRRSMFLVQLLPAGN